MKSFFYKSDSSKIFEINLKYKVYNNDELLRFYNENKINYIEPLIKYRHFIDEYLKSDDIQVIKILIKYNYNLEKYLTHPSKDVRKSLVDKSYRLDILINDLDDDVCQYAKNKQNRIDSFDAIFKFLNKQMVRF